MKLGKYIRTPEIREKNRKASTGRQSTEKKKRKISKFMKKWHTNHEHPRLGKKHTQATKDKMSRDRMGSGGSNWQGGKTLAVRTFRKSKQYRQWRRAVLERDNYTCRECGSKENITIRRIYAVKTHPELRLYVNNGKTLCLDCHKKTKNYGNRKVLSCQRQKSNGRTPHGTQ